MKRLALLAGAAGVAIALALPAGAASPAGGVRNASFEAGFAQWNVTIPAGASATIVPGRVRQGGGNWFARIKTDGPGGGASVDQTFWGDAGAKVTGFARFNDAESGSCSFIDSATVEIDGNAVFLADSCTTGSTGAVVWTYTLGYTGYHTIFGTAQNGVDDIVDSTLDMDAPLLTKITP